MTVSYHAAQKQADEFSEPLDPFLRLATQGRSHAAQSVSPQINYPQTPQIVTLPPASRQRRKKAPHYRRVGISGALLLALFGISVYVDVRRIVKSVADLGVATQATSPNTASDKLTEVIESATLLVEGITPQSSQASAAALSHLTHTARVLERMPPEGSAQSERGNTDERPLTLTPVKQEDMSNATVPVAKEKIAISVPSGAPSQVVVAQEQSVPLLRPIELPQAIQSDASDTSAGRPMRRPAKVEVVKQNGPDTNSQDQTFSPPKPIPAVRPTGRGQEAMVVTPSAVPAHGNNRPATHEVRGRKVNDRESHSALKLAAAPSESVEQRVSNPTGTEAPAIIAAKRVTTVRNLPHRQKSANTSRRKMADASWHARRNTLGATPVRADQKSVGEQGGSTFLGMGIPALKPVWADDVFRKTQY